jgi:hypothetical protein
MGAMVFSAPVRADQIRAKEVIGCKIIKQFQCQFREFKFNFIEGLLKIRPSDFKEFSEYIIDLCSLRSLCIILTVLRRRGRVDDMSIFHSWG